MEFNRDFKFDLQAASELLRDESTYGLTLMTILLEAYGEQLFDPQMDSIELYLEIEEDFRAQMTLAGENRVQACLLSMTTDAFYTDALVCRSVSMALYEGELGDMVNGVLEQVELPEVMWAVYEVGLLREDEEDFSPEVQRWIDQLVGNTAEEQDLTQPEVLPYYAQVLEDEKQELLRQLRLLGMSEAFLAQL